MTGLRNDGPRRPVEIGGIGADGAGDEGVVDMPVNAVGREHEPVAHLQRHRPVVDLDMRIDPERAAQIGLLRRDDHPVILGKLLQRIAGQAIDPAVADMEQMRGARFQHHHRQRADIPPVRLIGVAAGAGLGMQPGIGRGDDALGRGLHRPGVGCAVIVGEEALHRRFGGNPAHRTGADAVGEGDRGALQRQRRRLRNQGAEKILIGLLAALVRMLADREFQAFPMPPSRARSGKVESGFPSDRATRKNRERAETPESFHLN